MNVNLKLSQTQTDEPTLEEAQEFVQRRLCRRYNIS